MNCYRLGVRKKATESKKAKNAAKDPNKPKRPPSAFFVFMYASNRCVFSDFYVFKADILTVFIPFLNEGRSLGRPTRRSTQTTNLLLL